jgi:competence transcription factor ComK
MYLSFLYPIYSPPPQIEGVWLYPNHVLSEKFLQFIHSKAQFYFNNTLFM